MLITKWALLSGMLLTSLSQQAIATKVCDEKALKTAIDRFGQAFLVADTDTLDSMLVDDYIHVNGGSGNIIRKQAWLNWLKSRKAELQANTLSISRYDVELNSVVVNGKVGIVVGSVTSEGINKQRPFTSVLRFSNTWLCQDNQWFRAAFHDSHLKQ